MAILKAAAVTTSTAALQKIKNNCGSKNSNSTMTPNHKRGSYHKRGAVVKGPTDASVTTLDHNGRIQEHSV